MSLQAASAAAAALIAESLPGPACAADLPHLSVADPTAQALGYVEDAGRSATPQRQPGTICANCQL